MDIEKKWFVVMNPVAASGTARKKWPYIQQLLQENGLSYDFAQTESAEHATRLTSDAIAKGYRKIMAIGGDGTNNEVVNGICGQQTVPSSEVVYSLLPLGTGNDWIKTHKIPKDFKKCIAACKNMKTTLQDIGLVSYHSNGIKKERYFVNVAGMAYDAFLCDEIVKQKGKISNQFLYLSLVFKCLFKYDLRKARISFNDQVVEDYFYTINVGICRYSGGGMLLVPQAVPDDGQLALTICRKVSKLEVILNTYRFYSGTLDQHRQITIHKTKHIKVEAIGDEPTLVEVDGEFLGETPVEYFIKEKALQLIVP